MGAQNYSSRLSTNVTYKEMYVDPSFQIRISQRQIIGNIMLSRVGIVRDL